MKTTLPKFIAALFALLLVGVVAANAATLKDKTIVYSASSYLHGQPIPLGVDPYGYNYQAHTFNGSYFNAYANAANLPPYNGDDAAYLTANPTAANHWAWVYRNDQVAQKWNDAWLSNEDKDNDGRLDRPISYIGTGAWLTNHQSGDNPDGSMWNYFVKIVAVPASATLSGDVWVDSGKEIGPVIWGDFAVVQEVYNDMGTGDHGVLSKSSSGPGLGKF